MCRTLPLLIAFVVCIAVSPAARAQDDALGREVETLVAGLAADDFDTREQSYVRLARMGARALPWLVPALESEDPEVARQVERLVQAARHREAKDALSGLSTQNNDFQKSAEFEAIVAKGREIFPSVVAVLDEEDAYYPTYNYYRMRNAYLVLGRLVTQADVEMLLSRLNHPNVQHRILLENILEGFEPEFALAKTMIKLADKEAPPQARAHLIELCRNADFARNVPAVAVLAERLLEDEEPIVRAAALRYFLFARNEEILPAILVAALDEVAEVRAAAVGTLRNYRGPKVQTALKTALLDPEPTVRAAALGAFMSTAQADLAPLVRPYLKDPDPTVRSNAAQVLARFGDRAAILTLIELLDERNDDFLMRTLHSVVDALGRIGDPAALDPLFDLLADAEEFQRIATYRYMILRAIVQVGGEPVIDRVRPYLADDKLQNRQVVLDALGRIESEKIVPILLEALESGETRMRTSAVRGLTARGHAEAAESIAKALSEEDDPWFLSEAVRALMTFEHAAAVPRMLELLAEGDPTDNRRTALNYALIRAMVQFRVPAAAPRIAELAEASQSYRYSGIDGLARLGNPEVAPRVKALWEAEENDSVRMRMELCLARLDVKEPLTARLEALDPASPRIAEFLLPLGRPEEAKKLLLAMLEASPGNASTLYNLACAHAVAGEPDEAFAVLERALALRNHDRWQLATDPDLRSLAEDPRWAQALEKTR